MGHHGAKIWFLKVYYLKGVYSYDEQRTIHRKFEETQTHHLL